MGKSILLKYMSEPSGDISQRDEILQLPLIFKKKKTQLVAHGDGWMTMSS
jgi:hypothetical protein